MRFSTFVAVVLTLGVLCLFHSADAGVVGIDYGSEFIKVALVNPGSPFHIVLDEQAKRKSPQVVAFDTEERYFGNNALSMAVRRPPKTFLYASRLLGRTMDSPEVEAFKAMGLPYEYKEVENRGVVGFELSYGGETYVLSAEELVGMTLEYIRALCDEDAGAPVKDVVLTVPEFWSQAQRQAMLDAAALAGLNVLSLINENTAAATHFGIDRDFDANQTALVVFYNMGSTSTKVTLASYSGYLVRDSKRKNKTIGQVEILANTWDAHLGGLDFDTRIADELTRRVQKFLAEKGVKVDITNEPKVLAKIRKRARDTKQVLSANTEASISIEGVYKDYDFKGMLTRQEFITLSEDLFVRAIEPLTRLLKEQGVEVADIESIQLLGGSVRIPTVQSRLKEAIGIELSQNMDGDEAMVMGAVFRAANLSTQFQVRKLGLVDISTYPLGVRIKDLPKDSEAGEGGAVGGEVVEEEVVEEPNAPLKGSTATTDENGEDGNENNNKPNKVFSKRVSLFKKGNKLAKRKTVTFTHTRDVQVSVQHDNAKSLPTGVSLDLGSYNVTGVEAMFENPKYTTLLEQQKPRISLTFGLSSDGIVALNKAEATLEESIQVPIKKPKKPKVALPKIPVDETTDEQPPQDQEAPEDAAAAAPTPDADATNDNNKAEGEAEKAEGETTTTEKKGDQEEEATTTTAKTTASSADNEEVAADGATTATGEEEEPEKEEAVEYRTEVLTRRVPLDVVFTGPVGGIHGLNATQIRVGRTLLRKLKAKDDFKAETAKSKNELETFIYDTRRQFDEVLEFAEVSTEAQRESVLEILSAAETFLYDIPNDEENPAIFKSKLASVREVVDPILFRHSELTHRPQALETATFVLEYSTSLIANLTRDSPWIPVADLERLGNMTKNATEWIEEKQQLQAPLALTEDPVLRSKDIIAKVDPVAKFASELMKRKKPRDWGKPKPDPKKAKKTAKTTGEDDLPAEDEDAPAPDADAEIPENNQNPSTTNNNNNNNNDEDVEKEQGSTTKKEKDEL